ncbi:Histidinol-phosphate aminotransferase 1, partial [mine drainage metagenome]
MTGPAPARADGRRRSTAPEVRLDLNTLPFVNERALRRAFAGRAWGALGAYPDPTAEPLRAAIGDRLGIGIDRVWAGNGADEILERFVRQCTPPGGVIAILEPTFLLYEWLARTNGRRIVRVPAAAELPVDALVRCRADAYVIASPNNPTGAAFPRGSIEELIARTRGSVLLDEAYAEFAGQDFRDLGLSNPRVLVVRTFSKAYGLPGIRVGYAVGHPAAVRRLAAATPPFHLNAYSQRAAIAALADPTFVRRAVDFVRHGLPLLRDGLRRQGWPERPSAANFVLVGPIRTADAIAARLRSRGWRLRYLPARPPRLGG